MRLFATALTTLRFTINFLQLLSGVTVLIDPVAQAPWTPLLLFDQGPSSTYGKVIKYSTIFARMKDSVLTAWDSTPELSVKPGRRRIILIIIIKLRLLRCPLGLGSIALGLKIRTRIIKIAVGLIPRLTIIDK